MNITVKVWRWRNNRDFAICVQIDYIAFSIYVSCLSIVLPVFHVWFHIPVCICSQAPNIKYMIRNSIGDSSTHDLDFDRKGSYY